MLGRRNETVRTIRSLSGNGLGTLDPAAAAHEVSARLEGHMWPASVDVDIPERLPALPCSESEFRRVMEILLGTALEVVASDGTHHVAVGGRDDGKVLLFCVRSDSPSAFGARDVGECRYGDVGAHNRLMAEAKAMIAKSGGHLWVAASPRGGSAAYFTIPTGHRHDRAA